MTDLFEEVQYVETHKKYMVNIGSHKIPLEAMREFFRPIMTILCLVLCFQIGRIASAWTISTAQAKGCTLSFSGFMDMTVDMKCPTYQGYQTNQSIQNLTLNITH
jgi:hypothetical protein